jgi:release factor glutamine methyltransferase
MAGQSLSELLAAVRADLAASDIPSYVAESELLVGHVLGLRRSEIHMRPAREILPGEKTAVMNLVCKRCRRIPLQYLLGGCEFMSLAFKVRQGVFIPRPETEVLVEAVIERAEARDTRARRILDIGTGTGVIGISLADRLRPDLVVAVDISRTALVVARSNAILNHVVNMMVYAVADGVESIRAVGDMRFDIVACNPPYVAAGDIQGLEPEIRDHEPPEAIDGGAEGFDFYEGILPKIPSILTEGGLAAFEIGASQGFHVRRLFEKVGMDGVEVIRDLNGLDRVVIGRRP